MVIDQVIDAMSFLKKYYPKYEHVLEYDNAPTYKKRPDGALSVTNIPMKTSNKAIIGWWR